MVNEQKFETLCSPMLEPVTFFGGEGTDRLVDPYFFKLLMESVVRHYQLHKSAQHRITRMLMEICECAHREPFQQHLHTDQILEDNW